MLVLTALVVYIVIPRSRKLKNFIGKQRGFCGCPNCGDRWNWKESTSVQYGTVPVEYNSGTIDTDGSFTVHTTEIRHISTSVIICKECALHPEKIDPQRIKNDLLQYEWEEEKADAAVKAIIKAFAA